MVLGDDLMPRKKEFADLVEWETAAALPPTLVSMNAYLGAIPIAQALAAGFGERELAEKPILMLLEASGVHVGRAHQSLSARLADAQVAEHLDVLVDLAGLGALGGRGRRDAHERRQPPVGLARVRRRRGRRRRTCRLSRR